MVSLEEYLRLGERQTNENDRPEGGRLVDVLEREKGFEPSTYCLGSSHSATELLPRAHLVYTETVNT